MIYSYYNGDRGLFRDADGKMLPYPIVVDTETGVVTFHVPSMVGERFRTQEGDFVTAAAVFKTPISYEPFKS